MEVAELKLTDKVPFVASARRIGALFRHECAQGQGLKFLARRGPGHAVKDDQTIVHITSPHVAEEAFGLLFRTPSAAAAAVRAESFNSELKGTSTMRAD